MRGSPVRKRHNLFLLIAALLLAIAGSISTAAAQDGATTWTIQSGGAGALPDDASIEVNLFMPDSARIRVGDTVRWHNEGPHTVSFLAGTPAPPTFAPLPDGRLGANPAVFFPSFQGAPPPYDGSSFLNSGFLLDVEQDFALTFTKTGTFTYVCIIHPGMAGQIIVEPAGTAVQSQAELDQQAAAKLQEKIAQGTAAFNRGNEVTKEPGSGGTSRWHVKMGNDTPDVEILAFLPKQISVAAGDTVVFDNLGYAPHNVLFPAGGELPEFLLIEPQAAGPPNIVVNPRVLVPTQPSGGSYDGSAPLNSGLYTPEQLGASYAVTFTKPGSYFYVCSVHSGRDETGQVRGMVGTINVVAQAAQPLPATGEAAAPVPVALPNTGGSTPWTLALLTGAVALLLTGALLIRRRHI